VNRAFAGQGFDYRDEFFRVHDPYSRKRVRVLLSIDTEKTDLRQGPAYGKLERADNDYALAWVRQYGRGRAFYCTIAHNPRVFWDPRMLQFYLAAIQFVLGDLTGPTTPSGRLTPALRAQEQLGWRLGLGAPAGGGTTLFDAIDRAAALGLLDLVATDLQEVSSGLRKRFDPSLASDEMRQIRLKLDAAGVRLPAWQVHSLPSAASQARRFFEFARRMGVELLLARGTPEAAPIFAGLCDEYEITLALQSGDGRAATANARLEESLQLCRGRTQRLGVCGETALWTRAGLTVPETVGRLGDRLAALQMNDQDAAGGKMDGWLEEISRRGAPTPFFILDEPPSAVRPAEVLAGMVQSFNQATLRLTERGLSRPR
jgi:hypothetical protein